MGFAISCLLHLGILAWAFVTLHATPELALPDTQPISVAIITPSELTRLKQGDPDKTQLEAKAKDEPKPDISKKEAEKPKPVTGPPPAAEPPSPVEEAKPKEAPQPSEPPPAAKGDPIAEKLAEAPPPPEPAPGPSPEDLKKIEDEKKAEQQRVADEQRKAEEQKIADEKRKAEEKKKAEEKRKKEEQQKKLAEAKRKADEQKKKQFDADRIAALLDKTPDKRGAPNSSTPPEKATDYKGPTAGERDGRDTVLSAREQDLLRGAISAQLRGCWRLPGGGGGIDNAVVTLRWRMNADGSLDGEPQIERPSSDPVFRIAAEAAIRAVKTCSPFTLPPDKYSAWRMIIWDFDPREML